MLSPKVIGDSILGCDGFENHGQDDTDGHVNPEAFEKGESVRQNPIGHAVLKKVKKIRQVIQE
jgi:hypothetical protein